MKEFLTLLLLTFTISNPSFCANTSTVVLSDLSGNLWIETDGNATYDGEPGPSDVLVFLMNADEDTVVAQTLTVFGKYEFNSVDAGKYYLKIDASAFDLGGSLFGFQSCPGLNDADDMVDNDDNGSDSAPFDVFSSIFSLTNEDPMNDISVEYIDFCFFTTCDQPNPLAESSCDQLSDVTYICNINDINNLCATLPADSSGGVQPIPLCDGIGTAYNISWMAFVAADGFYSLNIDALECQIGNLGQQGIQVGVYTDCSFTEQVFCSGTCTIAPISIGSSLLNPGQVYYMYINGCDNQVCNYQITINGTAIEPSLEPNDVCVFSNGSFQCNDLAYCPDSDVLFTGDGLPDMANFTWSVTTISGTEYLGDSIVNTSENSLILNFPDEGKYNVCLTEVDNGCMDQIWNGVKCRELTTSFAIPMPIDEDFGEFFVCEGEIESFSVNEFAAEDPNGDGDPGWNAAIPEYMFGINSATAYTEGCSYQQQFSLGSFEPTPVTDVLVTVCEEDLPVQVDVLTFNIFNFSGNQTITIENLLLQNSKDQNGCDSIINLTVEKLNILQGAITETVCTMDGIRLVFEYIPDLSTDIAFLEFVWTDPQGNVLPNGADPTTIIAPFESGSGTYTLDVNILKNGVACTYTYFTSIDISLFLPPTPVISGPDLVCEDEETAMYIATGDGSEINFIWSFPGDVASASITGAVNDTLTIDWTGSNGGDVIVIGQNDCGQSNPRSYEVEIKPKTTPDFSIDTSVCIDLVTIVDFFGTGLNISDYIWDFDGGAIISGSGMGPYEVTWSTEGTKSVSLTTVDNDGCLSNVTTKNIEVKTPLAPTEVMCIPSVGEVMFTWEIPLMVSGFQVNVLSGQAGGVFAANSFTISGLDEGEEVTIELLTIPDDLTCGEFISTIISCTALDCIPPEILLTADNQETCIDGENITIEATIPSGETGSGIYAGPGIIDAVNGIFDPSEANVGINTIIYTFTSDVAGCVGTKTISIEVFDFPEASFIQDKDTMCITDILNLDYNGTLSPEIYDWDFEDGVGSGLLSNQDVVFNSPGLKNISLQVTKNGCISNIFTSTVFVEDELEDLVITCGPKGTDFVTFSWMPIGGVSLYEVTIDNDPPFFSPNTSVTIDGLDELQTVIITVNALSNTSCPGPSNTLSCITDMTISSEDLDLEKLRIYPNPVKDVIFIEGEQYNNLSLDLYDYQGRLIMSKDEVKEKLDVSAIPGGLYLLRITSLKSNAFKDYKIIVE